MKQPKDYALDELVRSFYKQSEQSLRKRQSLWESNIEVATNIFSGFIVSYLVWVFIVPIFWPEHKSSYTTAFGIVILFTISSYLRGIFWRRFFEKGLHKLIHTFVRRYF